MSASVIMAEALVFVFSVLHVVVANHMAWLLEIPDHEVGRGVLFSVFPESVFSFWVSVERWFVVDVG